MILAALGRADGVQVRAARLLGITEQSLWYRIKKHGIQVRVTGSPPSVEQPVSAELEIDRSKRSRLSA